MSKSVVILSVFFSTTCWIVLCCLSMSITLCKTEATLISSGPWFGSLFKSNATNWKHSSSFESLILIKAAIISQASFSWAALAKESLRCCCSEIRARYHPNPTPDRWPLESLPLGSETGIQVSAVVGIGDHLGRQLPVSLLVPVAVTSVDTTLLPTKFWRRNRVEPEVGALVSILKFGNPQASVIGIGGRLEGSGSLSPSERWFHYS